MPSLMTNETWRPSRACVAGFRALHDDDVFRIPVAGGVVDDGGREFQARDLGVCVSQRLADERRKRNRVGRRQQEIVDLTPEPHDDPTKTPSTIGKTQSRGTILRGLSRVVSGQRLQRNVAEVEIAEDALHVFVFVERFEKGERRGQLVALRPIFVLARMPR